jgi:hypothetical protein
MGPAALCSLLAVLVLVAPACQRKRIEVVSHGEDATGDYGQVDLDAAVQAFRQRPASPEAYRELAVKVEALRPQFNQGVADQAERHLVFLALGPMAGLLDTPLPEQMDRLALTVWPTALEVEPEEGESVRGYLERVCAGPLAGECKHVVPERWPVVLSALVWDRFKVRARAAYSGCRRCGQDPSFEQLLGQYDRHQTRMRTARAQEGDRVERSAWPDAGDHAAEWSGATVLDLVADPRRFAGEVIDGDWGDRIRMRPGAAAVLGVHMRPRTEVRHVRAVVEAAARAGYSAVALQARERAYPYALREYRIATSRGGRGQLVQARDVDTVQILVRGLDAAAARAGGGAGGGEAVPVMRLAR